MTNTEIEEIIQSYLAKHLPIDHSFSDVIKFSVFPAGKLFRPNLVYAMAKDLGSITDDHKLFASSIELHHAYTLIHDDLPAMDDDDQRRGRAATHIKFGEFRAILAGDALLNISMGMLVDLKQANILSPILKLYTELTGAKGLIFGQVLDLSNEHISFDQILTIHKYKTANLIELAIVGSAIISGQETNRQTFSSLGQGIGIVFQLLDDLSELNEEPSSHELEINPFLKEKPSLVFQEIIKHHNNTKNIIEDFNLNYIGRIYFKYIDKMISHFTKNQRTISENIKEELDPKFLK